MSKPFAKDIFEIVVAFVAAWLFLQGLGFALGTSMPVVSVVSESMEPILHRGDLLVVVGPGD
jgi:signal peptidase I